MSEYYNDFIMEIDDAFIYDNYVKLSIISMVFYSFLDKIYKKKQFANTMVQTNDSDIIKIKKDVAASIIQNIVKERLSDISKKRQEKQAQEEQAQENEEKQENEENEEKEEKQAQTSYLSYLPLVGKFF